MDRVLRWEASQMPHVVLPPKGIHLGDLWGRPRGCPLWSYKEGQNTGFGAAARRSVVKVITRWRTSRNADDLDWTSLTSNSWFCFPKDYHFRIRVNEGKQILAGWFCIHSFMLLLSHERKHMWSKKHVWLLGVLSRLFLAGLNSEMSGWLLSDKRYGCIQWASSFPGKKSVKTENNTGNHSQGDDF